MNTREDTKYTTYLNKDIEGMCVGPFGLHFNRKPSLWMRFVLKILGFKRYRVEK